MVFGHDPIVAEVKAALAELAAGRRPAETRRVDLKEEAGRRGPAGALRPTSRENEPAARKLAAEAACMANSDGGGALIVGVCDDGTLVGTALGAEWLRGRIYDHTERRLTVSVDETEVNGVRLLVVRAPQAIEPVRVNGRITWRVDDRCVEIDASTWHARRMTRDRFDWSEQDSQVDPRTVRPAALEIARRHLRASGEQHAAELASASDAELLRRLNVVTGDGYLTNAGALAFVGRGAAAIDYLRRSAIGEDRRRRVREDGLGLLEELDAVESAIDAFNEERTVRRGFVVGHVRELPPGAVREAVVNGMVHRDWANAAPTVVEHIGRSLVVTSPGGFVGGVTPDNIITHPSQSRNRALTQLFADLRIAEREGVGVDRMVRDMLAVGYPAPDIRESAGPHVRAALVGEPLDEGWIRFVGRLLPDQDRTRLDVLLLLRRLITHGWVDARTAAPILQLSAVEARASIHTLLGMTIEGSPLIRTVTGVPADAPDAWQLSGSARRELAVDDGAVAAARPDLDRSAVALDWCRRRGRVSTTEIASIVGAPATSINRVLHSLEETGAIVPGRSNRTGRGFFYVPSA
jgi:ATP-dependent DNA helicase RecG